MFARISRAGEKAPSVKLIYYVNYVENRAGPSNLGSVFSQIILCKQLAPDFNAEELRSIQKDSADIQRLVDDLSEFMPMEESYGISFLFSFFFINGNYIL